jgi:hypothetical protein
MSSEKIDADVVKRALAGQLSPAILEELRKGGKSKGSKMVDSEIYPIETSLLSLSERGLKTEKEFTLFSVQNPDMRDNPAFRFLWRITRRNEVIRYLGQNKDSLSSLAIMFPESRKSERLLYDSELAGIYLNEYAILGTEKAGRLEEIIGPSGSGKSNFEVWKALKLLLSGYPVFCNFKLFNLPEEVRGNYREVHTLTEILKLSIEKRKELRAMGKEIPIFWVLDEQQKIKGGSTKTANTRESRFISELLVTVRKKGIYVSRARQEDNIPNDQRGWVWIIIRKDRESPETVEIEYLNEGKTYKKLPKGRIDNMKDYFDTNDPCDFDYDIDMEKLNKYTAMHPEDNEESTLRYLNFSIQERERGAKLEELKIKRALGEIPRKENKGKQNVIKHPSYKIMGFKKEKWESLSPKERERETRKWIKAHKETVKTAGDNTGKEVTKEQEISPETVIQSASVET